MSTSILKHFRNYASAGMLAALGGILSFPILTRNLSIEDYGLLGLLTASITVAVAIGKLGIQHSIIRFFAQIENGSPEWCPKQLYSTALLSMLFLSVLVSVLWVLFGNFVLPDYMGSKQIPKLFFIASGVVFLRLAGSGIVNFLRAQQSSGVVSISQVIHKYLHLILIVIALWFDFLSTASVIFFLFIAELTVVAYIGHRLWPKLSLNIKYFSPGLIKALITFGLPLMAYESLSLVLRLSDRYVIEALLGVKQLGQYSASYNLTAYLDLVIISGMIQAVRPMYTHIWESEGRSATQTFLDNSFNVYVNVGIPLVLGFSLLAPDLLVLLSGDRYYPGTVIIPYVALSFFLEGAVLFLGAGLHLGKNTRVFLQWAFIAAVLNIGLNILLVPYFGLPGAAIVTIVSYLVFLLGVTVNSFRSLQFSIQFKQIILIPLLALLIYIFLNQLVFDNRLLSMFIKASLALVSYSALLLLDARIRSFIVPRIKKIRLGGQT